MTKVKLQDWERQALKDWDPTEEDDRLTCWGCREKFNGSKADALQAGWQIQDEELYCDSCSA